MIPAIVDKVTATDCEYENLLADLFHALSQPLTTLQCCLTESLQKEQSTQRYRRDLRTALQQAKSVVSLTAAIRELVVFETSNGRVYASDLSACVREVVDDLLPVAHSAGLKLSLTCSGSCSVKVEAEVLRHAIFCVIESALTHSRPGSQICTTLTRGKDESRLTVRIPAQARKQNTVFHKAGGTDVPALHCRLTLAIARRTFENAGGSFQIHRGTRQTSIIIRAPLAHREPALPLARSSLRCG